MWVENRLTDNITVTGMDEVASCGTKMEAATKQGRHEPRVGTAS